MDNCRQVAHAPFELANRRTDGGAAQSRQSLRPANLLNDVDALGAMFDGAARDGDSLDLFLLAAGLNQIVEDHLHDAPYPIDDAARLLAGSGSRAGAASGRALRGLGLVARRLSAQRQGARRALDWQRRMASVLDGLAQAVIAGADADAVLRARCRNLALEVPRLPPTLQQSVIRIPACFHSFDQRPEDFDRLAERYVGRWPDPARPLLVIGVRTSGSYLAPLVAAALRARGRRAGSMTIRPGRALLAHERAAVRALVRERGQVLMTDDPPVTGRSLAASGQQLRHLGVSPESLVFLVALQDDGERIPPGLAGREAVVLGAGEWSIESRLEPGSAATTIEQLLGDELELDAIEALPVPATSGRHGHRRARFRVRGTDPRDGGERELDVLAIGVGAGYLGAHQLPVAEALGDFGPRVFGLRDGVLYREWIADDRRLTARSRVLPEAAARYVAMRHAELRVERDTSVGARGARPVWEVVGLVLARLFGRAAPVARVMFIDRAVSRLLRVDAPSVVDGCTWPDRWFAGRGGSPVVKVGFSDRTYWSLGLACFDPVFDLAGVGALEADMELPARVRTAWLRETAEDADPERWLLYELAHQWGRLREDPGREAEVRQAGARAAARYFAAVVLGDVERVEAGPLCALDIDGVFEQQQLGFSAPTRASAAALRALVAHGYSPVLVSGRGLDEVRDRCRAYGLAGGVAEYGSAICVEHGERVVRLADDRIQARLAQLRSALESLGGVTVDPAYVCAVRAYRVGADASRRPLDPGEAAACVRAAGGPALLRMIPGEGQTDFVPAGIDKATGLRALATELHAERVALAVGDTAEDIPMLALAAAAFAPAHAPTAVTDAGAVRVGRPYQVGLWCAVETLLGHAPGGCAVCRAPKPGVDRALLLELLSVAEEGRRGVAPRVLRLARALRLARELQ